MRYCAKINAVYRHELIGLVKAVTIGQRAWENLRNENVRKMFYATTDVETNLFETTQNQINKKKKTTSF